MWNTTIIKYQKANSEVIPPHFASLKKTKHKELVLPKEFCLILLCTILTKGIHWCRVAFINLNVESQIVHEKAHPHITLYLTVRRFQLNLEIERNKLE